MGKDEGEVGVGRLYETDTQSDDAPAWRLHLHTPLSQQWNYLGYHPFSAMATLFVFPSLPPTR